MGRLPAAVDGPQARGPRKLVVPLHLHDHVKLKLTLMQKLIQENAMRKLIALAFILAISVPLPAFAQSQEDQAACTPDVMRLCQQAIPDQSRVVACLVRSRLQLSPACAGVFNRARTAILRKTSL